MRVGVVGAGPGGLLFALAARRLGADVTVFERRGGVEGGVALGIQPNGLRALHAVGAFDRLSPRLAPIRGGRLVLVPGERTLAEFDYESAGLSDLRPMILLRADLLACLAELANHAGVDLRFGSAVDAIDTDGGTATSGRREAFDVVVGADGSGSSVRGAVGLGDQAPTPWAAVRAVVAGPTVPSAVEYWGHHGRRIGMIPIHANLTYLYASAHRDDFAGLRSGDLDGWKRLWAEFGPITATLLNAVPDAHALRVDDIVEVRCRRWVRGRVFLLGDAAHAMTPDLGQGANTAMVDAAALAVCLVPPSGQPVDLVAAARAYQPRRRSVRRVQRLSRMVGTAAHMRSHGLRRLVGTATGVTSRPALVRRQGAKRMAAIPRRDERAMSTLAARLKSGSQDQ